MAFGVKINGALNAGLNADGGTCRASRSTLSVLPPQRVVVTARSGRSKGKEQRRLRINHNLRGLRN
jgi:hypothetical protein